VPVLVLGASGFIGRWVVRRLQRSGADLQVVVRQRTSFQTAGAGTPVVVRVADLMSADALEAVVDAARPAVVFNLAGYGVDRTERDPAFMAALNDHLVERLCRRLSATRVERRGPVRVHVGSALEYGRIPGRLEEDRTGVPTSDYGRTKLAGTGHVRRYAALGGLRGVVARLFTVYGPGEHPTRLLPSLMRVARNREPLPLTQGTQCRDFTYVEDVVEGLLRLAAAPDAAGQVVNLATGRLRSVRHFAETAASVLDVPRGLLQFGALPDLPDEMFRGEVDVERLHGLTSWVPLTDIADGVRRSWEFEHAG
jgi:nucleoside-diphosphate-sugar epimerase